MTTGVICAISLNVADTAPLQPQRHVPTPSLHSTLSYCNFILIKFCDRMNDTIWIVMVV